MGNIHKDVATGALVTFADCFESPPHIHNISYRAAVISGQIHNDDSNATKIWMGPGSFWSQALGEYRIMASRGKHGERNVVWMDAEDVEWVDGESGAQMAFFLGAP